MRDRGQLLDGNRFGADKIEAFGLRRIRGWYSEYSHGPTNPPDGNWQEKVAGNGPAGQ